MAPILSLFDLFNGLPADAIFPGKSCDLFTCLKRALDVFYLLLCQLRSYVKLANLSAWLPVRICSSFLNTIIVVFSFGSKKKMTRPHAFWVVAFMKNAQAFWDLSMLKFPRYTARHKKSAPSTASTNTPITKNSRRSPNPTPAKMQNVRWNWPVSIDFIPEPFPKWSHDKKAISGNGDCQ